MTSTKDAILELIMDKENGYTWQELQPLLLKEYGLKKGHGSISGALTKLHSEGHVFYLHEERDGCHPYFHKSFRGRFSPKERQDQPRKGKWNILADSMYEALTTSTPHSPKWLAAIEAYEKAIK